MTMEITVLHAKSGKTLTTLQDLSLKSTIGDVKRRYQQKFPKYYPTRQAFKIDPKGKLLKDEDILGELGMTSKRELYFKDLGPQIGWSTVFFCEYAGPLAMYLVFYIRPSIIYGVAAASEPRSPVVHIAAACYSFHYIKRILETVFIHRFSNATMPIMNLFKNCSYYWGFSAFISYFINHPLYTPPTYGDLQVYGGLAGFLFSEFGNFSIHNCFKNMRPKGSKIRKIPMPDSNPFTQLFKCVSCPNYTYEIMAWISFSAMTQCLPALLFTAAGFYQMTVWAIGKHKNYRKEFKDYPRGRKSIVPFLI